jgi:hypothetical protein
MDSEIDSIGNNLYQIMKNEKTFEFPVVTELVPQILLLSQTFTHLSIDEKKQFVVESLVLAVQLSKKDALMSEETKLLSEAELKELFHAKDKTIELIRNCVPIMIDTAMMAIKGYFIFEESKQKCCEWWASFCSVKKDDKKIAPKYKLDTSYFVKIPDANSRFNVIKQKWKRSKQHMGSHR